MILLYLNVVKTQVKKPLNVPLVFDLLSLYKILHERSFLRMFNPAYYGLDNTETEFDIKWIRTA